MERRSTKINDATTSPTLSFRPGAMTNEDFRFWTGLTREQFQTEWVLSEKNLSTMNVNGKEGDGPVDRTNRGAAATEGLQEWLSWYFVLIYKKGTHP